MSDTDVRAALRPWRRRLWLQRTATCALWGIAAGLVAAAAVLLAARFVLWADVFLWAAAAVPVGAVAGLAHALATPPAYARTARRVDLRLGLADRAATAWDLRDSAGVFAVLQRRDTVAALGRHDPSAVPLRPAARPLLVTLAGLLAAAALVLLPNPMDRVQAEHNAFQERIAEAKQEIQQAREALQEPGSPLTAEQREAIEKALKALEERLAEAGDKPEALAALSEAERALQELREPGQAQALQQVASALGSAPAGASLAEALASGDAEALAEAMDALSAQLASLSPEERLALAAALQRAANAAGGAEGLPGALRGLAKALASGNADASEAALDDLESLLAGLQQGAATEQTVEELLAALSNARGSVSGVPGSQSGSSTSGSGQGNGSGEGEGSGQGQGEGSGQGQGSGAGSGAGTGSGSGTGTGGGSPGVGAGGGQGGMGAGNAPGSKQGGETPRLGAEGETVFVPSQGQGGLPSVPVGSGPGTAAGDLRPYREVIGEYAEQARSHIERSPVPEGYKDLVRRYFAEVEE